MRYRTPCQNQRAQTEIAFNSKNIRGTSLKQRISEEKPRQICWHIGRCKKSTTGRRRPSISSTATTLCPTSSKNWSKTQITISKINKPWAESLSNSERLSTSIWATQAKAKQLKMNQTRSTWSHRLMPLHRIRPAKEGNPNQEVGAPWWKMAAVAWVPSWMKQLRVLKSCHLSSTLPNNRRNIDPER